MDMELPRRNRGDELLKPGALLNLRSQLRRNAHKHDLTTVIACRIAPTHRPLIIAAGPKAIYEPWDLFSADPHDPWGADVVVTGEEYVLLSLLEVLLSIRASDEPLRTTFIRVRDSGMLDEIPGLVYGQGGADGVPEELVDTGPQRLLGDLDELPHPTLGC